MTTYTVGQDGQQSRATADAIAPMLRCCCRCRCALFATSRQSTRNNEDDNDTATLRHLCHDDINAGLLSTDYYDSSASTGPRFLLLKPCKGRILQVGQAKVVREVPNCWVKPRVQPSSPLQSVAHWPKGGEWVA